MTIITVLLAGGAGERLKPLPGDLPKILRTPPGHSYSLLQNAALRALKLSPAARVVTVTSAQHAQAVHSQLAMIDPALGQQLLVEQERRNTAAAIAIAVRHVLTLNPAAVCWVMPCDHVIDDVDALCTAVQLCTLHPGLSLLGIAPNAPVSDYGYLLCEGNRVTRFIEKPEPELAAALLAQGAMWNSGMFIFPAAWMREQFLALAPEIWRGDAAAPLLPFDRAIVEKLAEIQALRLDIGWQDLGTPERWAAASEIL